MKFLDRLARICLALAMVSLIVMTSLVVISAAMRYLADAPFGFTEELVALLYMAMIFLAVPLATVQRKHIALSLLPRSIEVTFRRPLRVAASLIMLVFCTWFAVAAFDVTAQSWTFGSRTEQARLSLWPWMGLMVVIMVFVAVISAAQLFDRDGPDEPTAEGDARGDSL
jgi:TRAP-type C4-dicarboxylate transport system permease small subunit